MDILDPYQWKYRLVIYTVDPEDRERLEQLIDDETEALRERDIRLIAIGESVEREPEDDHFPHLVLDREDRDSLADAMDLRKGRTEFILIGKDGGAKERIDRMDFDYLFQAIDRMPMRQAEMRAK